VHFVCPAGHSLCSKKQNDGVNAFCYCCCCLQDKLVLAGKADAAEEPIATVMLAANPVKLAQQRKKSANGGITVAPATAGGGMSGSSTAAGGSVTLQLPASPAGGCAASRVKQGMEKQQTSRLRTASRETAD
jgi:hypothetical protein